MRDFRFTPLALLLMLSTLGLSACFGGSDFEEQFSDEGLRPEAYLPGDVGMVLSYSLRNESQRQAVEALQEKMGGEDLSKTFSESFNTQFSEAGLDYEKDLVPAFGDDFRTVYAARPNGEETEVFSATTLQDPNQLVDAFDLLADAGSFEKQVLSDRDVYVSEEDSFYATIHEDLLLMATDPADLVNMVEQDEGDSLWGQDLYQDALENLGEEFVFYGLLFPSQSMGDVNLMTGLSVASVPAVIDYQILTLRADTAGLRFDVTVQANKDKAKEVGFAFDSVPRSEPYLYEEFPSEQLMGYMESFGLKQTLDEAGKLEDEGGSLEQLRTTFRNYFGMDFDEEFMSFFDKGYALALHENDGLVPGISIMVDTSSDEDHAEELINKMDGQISGLITVFEESLPNAMVKDTVEINGAEFNRVKLDLSAIPRTEDSPIPSVVSSGPIQLVYGYYEDRLLISTAQLWEEDLGTSIADSDLYKTLDAQMDSADQGLILLDADGLSSFVGTLRALREQLGLAVSEQALQMEDFLKNFYGAIARSQSGAYTSNFTGYLMLAD